MYLNTFLWEGVSRFHQTLKGSIAQKKVKNPCLRLYNSCTSTFMKENLFLTFKCKSVHKCFVTVNSKISVLKKWNKKWQTKSGQHQKLFWAKGPNFVGEVIVSGHCVLNCWSLGLWFQELSKTPWLGGKQHIISELWVYFKSVGKSWILSENLTAPSWQVITFTVIIFWKYSQLL